MILWPRCGPGAKIMANRALTDRTLKALKPAPAGKRYERRDDLVTGLLVRVTETGKRTFMLQTRYPGSQQPTRRAASVAAVPWSPAVPVWADLSLVAVERASLERSRGCDVERV